MRKLTKKRKVEGDKKLVPSLSPTIISFMLGCVYFAEYLEKAE